MQTPRLADVVSGLLILLAGGGIWFFTRSFPTLQGGYPGPALFPGVVALALVACGGALLIQGARRPARLRAELSDLGVDGRGLLRLAAVVALAFLYPLLQGRVGFVPTVAALIFGVATLLRAHLLIAAVVAVGGTAVIYFAFTRLLGVPL